MGKKTIGLICLLLALLCVSCMAASVTPLAMSNAAVGGSALNKYTPGVVGGSGVNNIGLLIRTWGKVTAVDTASSCFYIDDGSSRIDASGNVGLRVSYSNLASGVTIVPPAVGNYVTLTAISSTIMIDANIYSNLRPRSQSDIQIFAL